MQAVEQIRLLGDERFAELYEALSQNGFGPLDAEVAKSLRFRPQAIRKLPMAQRARKGRQILLTSKNAELSYEMLGAYLMQACKELVTEFLEATGVPHEDGMIEDLGHLPDESKVADAVSALDAKFEAEQVTIYLALAAQQWPQVAKIDELWRARAGAPSA